MRDSGALSRGQNRLNDGSKRVLRLGVAGLGRAFTVMLPTFVKDDRVALVAAADSRAEARDRFTAEFSAKSYQTVEELCADPQVEVVYVATPHQHHAMHTVLAAGHGKHVLIEKPMALTLDECRSMIGAAESTGVRLIVGHSHSFDAPVARAHALIEGGTFGPVRMIAALNYTDFIYRPRRPEELDTAQGGGVAFNQAAHQVDVVRLLGGGLVKSVRAVTGGWDRARPTEGAYATLLTFQNGAFATLNYNGYGHFDSDEFQSWVGELGERKTPNTAKPVPSFGNAAEEAQVKTARNYGGVSYRPPRSDDLMHQHFGMIIASCERADLRPMPNGVIIYRNGSVTLDPLPPPQVPRVEVIDELYDAIAHDRPPLHDGRWAMATMEVCLALLQSAREGRDIHLAHQVAVP
jgi:phthalate 4,5-cis-dihydrodiol dehydrogenase